MEQFLGQILMVGFNFAPSGWAFCNGQLLPISQNNALFALLGTTFGGDGVSNFALPNLQGSVPLHFGAGFNMGQVGGVQNMTLTVSNMPVHNHPLLCSNTPGPNTDPTGGYCSEVNTGGRDPSLSPSYATTSSGHMAAQAIGVAGGTLPFSVMQPYLCVNFIIALTGIFPSRG